ncbi:Gfo/Idh/MocA family protein [Spirillospora sp. CA-294931]|uniref:Gfo/Idh/MocA family protein n=1 Tax=Spirillospora sp. CA-294931 TaxID=3240042 RepID=UPI003D8B70D8
MRESVGAHPVSLAVAGAGSRGLAYARRAVAQGRAEVVAVAEPRPAQRESFAAEFGLDPGAVFASETELLAAGRLADAVVIATPDRRHADAAVAAAGLGYHILLEKPMALTERDCLRIIGAVERADVLLAVCHVLRYTPYTRALKELIASGRIGEIASIQHLEPVGWWHQAHSYVRGQWRSESESGPMLLTKSSHDLDWLMYVMGEIPVKVSSFGGLLHFTPANRPPGATDRCVTCPVEPDCAYSAKKIYLSALGDPAREYWPLSVLTEDITREGVLEALAEGPYGRCVYAGDNDVVDHQVVNLEFPSGATASFTMTAFTALDFRQTRIFGTKGTVEGDGKRLRLHDFTTDTIEVVETGTAGDASAADGHGGADDALIEAFVRAVADGDPAPLLSDARTSLVGHQVVWAAERARTTASVTDIATGSSLLEPSARPIAGH